MVHRAVADTGSEPLVVCRRLLAGVAHDAVTATGYGRHLFRDHWPAATVITEIKAVAAGATALVPGCRTIIDIGGQDTKVIALDASGRVRLGRVLAVSEELAVVEVFEGTAGLSATHSKVRFLGHSFEYCVSADEVLGRVFSSASRP